MINDGQGHFTVSKQKLPGVNYKVSTGAVCSADIDQDGDLDLFIGERIKVGSYGARGSGFILANDGQGNYTNVTDAIAKELHEVGMITDAEFIDIDKDGDDDLIIVGEFMSPNLYLNDEGVFHLVDVELFEELKGWWNDIHIADLDQDGNLDLVMGNHGLNSRLRASIDHPLKLFYGDFDKNGSYEGILSFNAEDGKDYPYALRHDLIGQLKYLKRKFPNFESFKNADIEMIFDESQLQEAQTSIVNELRSTVLLNKGDLEFEKVTLPKEAQLSPMFTSVSGDFDEDGDIDILMGGNLFNVRPEIGSFDASYGVFLEFDLDKGYRSRKGGVGFHVKGEIRDLLVDSDRVHVVRSRDSIMTFSY